MLSRFAFVVLTFCPVIFVQLSVAVIGQTTGLSTRFDFDGDRKADPSVFRPSSGDWWFRRSADGIVSTTNFGLGTDQLVASDYDGDGKTDLGVFRGGVWYRLKSSTATVDAVNFGVPSDVPVPADFDGDGRSDIAVFRPIDGTWYRLNSGNGQFVVRQWGALGDIPIAGDYDDDGKADYSVFRPSNGKWYRINSLDESAVISAFGTGGDVPLAGDFDGDRKFDLAVWRPSTGYWYVLRSSDNSVSNRSFGLSTDLPVPADYDGDGIADFAVYRPSNSVWYRINSGTNVFESFQFGLGTDFPVPMQSGVSSTPQPNRPPVAVNDTYALTAGTLNTPAPGVLSNDTDADGNSLTAVLVAGPTASQGTLTLTPNGSFAFSPATGFSGPATFTYRANDGLLTSNIATVTLNVSSAPSFTCDYYASPTGTPSGSGTSSSPWDLRSALSKTTLVTGGKILCLRGGTYRGKYRSRLNGAVVRSAPSEWAVIDGFSTTTLVSAISATQTSFTVADGSVLSYPAGADTGVGVLAEGELIAVYGINGNNVTQANRGGATGSSPPIPHPAGTTLYVKGTNLWVEGNGTTYRDFEITNSIPFRDRDTTCENIRGIGIQNVAAGNKFINMVVHDVENGILTSNASSNTELYGNIVYNNGLYRSVNGSVEGYAHGLYLENGSGYSRVYEDIIFNNFNLNTQMFGVTASYVGGDVQGSIWANSGAPMAKFYPERRSTNLLIGTDSQRIPFISIKDSHFVSPLNTSGSGIKLGYGSGAADGVITNNYFFGGGGRLLEVIDTPNLMVSGNKFYGVNPTLRYTLVYQNSQYNWNNNTYYGGAGRYIYNINDPNGGENRKFDVWRTETGFDANSVETSTGLPSTVIVRPNSYQPGRANIIIYATSASTSINVNLSNSGLSNGQSYVIRNAFNYFGPIVLTGTYNSNSPTISVPLTGAAATVAPPVGHGYTPPTTCPEFCAMVVVPN